MLSIQVLNTKRTARRLGCSETWAHTLAASGKLKAYIYGEEGELIEHEKKTKKQGRALYFLAEDVEQYRPAVQRRPRVNLTRLDAFLKGKRTAKARVSRFAALIPEELVG